MPVTPLAPESIPLPRLPHYSRIKCGDNAGGAFAAHDKALTARQDRKLNFRLCAGISLVKIST